VEALIAALLFALVKMIVTNPNRSCCLVIAAAHRTKDGVVPWGAESTDDLCAIYYYEFRILIIRLESGSVISIGTVEDGTRAGNV
jgi:hypothetical protein